MTLHHTDGPDHSHDPQHTAHDLDQQITESNAELEALLDEVIDLDAGWQALNAQQPPPPPATKRRVRSPDNLALFPELGSPGDLPEPLANIDLALAEVIEKLGRVSHFASVVSDHHPEVLALVETNRHEIVMLRRGLRVRTLGKQRSSGHIRRSRAGLAEACELLEAAALSACDHPAGRRLRLVLDYVVAARMLLKEVHPRIMRLFDNAGETTPCTPVPPGR